jgi:hypothetical protein
MSTINDVLAQQKKYHILAAPSKKVPASATEGTATFNLCNSTTSNTVYAYVTGIAINNNSATYLLGSDGVTPCTCPENIQCHSTFKIYACIHIYFNILRYHLKGHVLNI